MKVAAGRGTAILPPKMPETFRNPGNIWDELDDIS